MSPLGKNDDGRRFLTGSLGEFKGLLPTPDRKPFLVTREHRRFTEFADTATSACAGDHPVSAVLSLAPTPEQEPWSGAAVQTLPHADADPRRHPFVILNEHGELGATA